MNFTLNTYEIGLLASVVTEAFKFFPVLKVNSVITALTAVVITAVGTYLFSGIGFDWTTFGQCVLWAFVNYGLVVQPIATTAGLSSQK